MLYIIATPIGNLDDLSIRQAKTLAASDIILSEDTRSANILSSVIRQRFDFKFKSNQKIISYYKEKEFEKLPEVIEYLKENKNVCLISESGTPLISDPGYLLIKTAVKEKIPLTVIPGPSAVTTALVYSGFNPNQFMFLGFPPKKPSQKTQLINKLSLIKKSFPNMVFVFFESPQRIIATLQLFNKLKFGDEIVICREMTKMFEEIVRGKAGDLINRPYKGEITVVIK